MARRTSDLDQLIHEVIQTAVEQTVIAVREDLFERTLAAMGVAAPSKPRRVTGTATAARRAPRTTGASTTSTAAVSEADLDALHELLKVAPGQRPADVAAMFKIDPEAVKVALVELAKRGRAVASGRGRGVRYAPA